MCLLGDSKERTSVPTETLRRVHRKHFFHLALIPCVSGEEMFYKWRNKAHSPSCTLAKLPEEGWQTTYGAGLNTRANSP